LRIISLRMEGMIQKLMRTATGSCHSHIAFQQLFRETNNSLSAPRNARSLIILKQSLKARHKLICLGYRILIRIESVLISQPENIADRGSSAVNNMLCKLQVSLFSRQAIQPYHRLQYG